MTDLEVAGVPESDLDRALELSDTVFHHQARDKESRERIRWFPLRAERYGVYDQGQLSAFLAALPMRLSVPGGSLDCAGVTMVGVLPTHRRRGLLTAMMERMMADSLGRGRPLAALYASEGSIYGRYGYGVATSMHTVEIDSRKPLDLRTTPDPRPLRMLAPEEAQPVLAPMYERVRERRPGQVARDEEWWRRWILPRVEEDEEELSSPRVVVLKGAAGDPSGYAIYRTRWVEDVGGLVQVAELEGDTPEVEAALWQFVASIDLTVKVRAGARPVDDLLPLMTANAFQVTPTKLWRGLWLRLLDVKAALEQRSWAADGRFVLEVRDVRLPGNQGRWRLDTRSSEAPGAVCERTDADPDLTFETRDLASAYLGGVPVRHLVRAGLVAEHTPGAAGRLDAALTVPYAPYTLDDF